MTFTRKQGQYLAVIYYYIKLNGRAPSDADMQRYFKTAPPSVHRMVVQLDRNGLIEREPYVARSIKLLVAEEEIPALRTE